MPEETLPHDAAPQVEQPAIATDSMTTPEVPPSSETGPHASGNEGVQQYSGIDELPPHPDEHLEDAPEMHSVASDSPMHQTVESEMPPFEATPGDPIETAQDIGSVAAEGTTRIPVVEASSEPATSESAASPVDGNIAEQQADEWPNREPSADRAQWMADKDKDLQVAASAADRIGRSEKAEELRQQADVEAQKGAEEYDHEQVNEAERKAAELRIEELKRRGVQERQQRRDKEVNELVDKVLEAVNLEPSQRELLLDDMDWPPGHGDEPKIATFYERLGLTRPGAEDSPTGSWDVSQGGPSTFIGSTQVESYKSFETPTTFGVTIREVRYKPGHQYDLNSARVRLEVKKTSEEA